MMMYFGFWMPSQANYRQFGCCLYLQFMYVTPDNKYPMILSAVMYNYEFCQYLIKFELIQSHWYYIIF